MVEIITLFSTETSDGSGAKLTVTYDTEADKVAVAVSLKSGALKTKSFRPVYRPIFGLDVLDQGHAMGIAEKLLVELEAEELSHK